MTLKQLLKLEPGTRVRYDGTSGPWSQDKAVVEGRVKSNNGTDVIVAWDDGFEKAVHKSVAKYIKKVK